MLFKTILRTAMFLLVVVTACPAQVSVPDTPAGRTLQAWLDTFNSADRAKIETYIKAIDHNQSVDAMLGFRTGTGGFDLLSIESSEPLHIRFRVKEKNSETRAIGTITVKDGQPPTIETFGLRALPPGVEPVNVVLDGDLRKKLSGEMSKLIAPSSDGVFNQIAALQRNDFVFVGSEWW